MEFKQKNTKALFIIFIVIFALVYAIMTDFSRMKSYNIMSKLTLNNKKNVASSDIALVVIDDKSLHDIGRWPWKREYYLEIFDYIETYTNAKLMGYDGLIMAPDSENPKSDEKFFKGVKNFKKLSAGYAFSYDEFEKGINSLEYDKLLKEKSNLKIFDKRYKTKKTKSYLKSFTALQGEYFKNINSLGFVNVPEDSDGYVRKASQIIEYKDSLYPSLALLMYSKYTGISNFILTDKYITISCLKS